MKQLIVLFILFSCTENIMAQDNSMIPSYFYKRLEGKINNKLDIEMNLTRLDSVLDGNYFYENIGEPIYFHYYSYMGDDGNIHIEEEGGYDEEYNTIITGIFEGKFISGDELDGKWMNQDSSETYDFYLKENYPAGSAKFDIKHLNKNYGVSDYANYAVSIELVCPVMIDYPDQAVRNKINSYLMNFYLNGSMQGGNGYSTLTDRIDSFIEDYRQEIEADSEVFKDYKPIYENNEFTSIAFNSDSILSLEISEYLFTGGAHGNSSFTLVSFNLATGDQIKLDDIFYGNYHNRLNKAGEKIFREQFRADSARSLYDQGYFGFENGFALNDNFDIYKGGIKFQFNPYEAGAYAIGAPEIFIPWSEIRDIIRDDSPLAKMLNDPQSR
jgi:hypothetical protein